ncbi:MAG: class I SAM-dependent methyltransferase [Elusimicrobia bacterium]|nr:class I SAM-dependent methyltransferase [Elusimicrobiota bacterium]
MSVWSALRVSWQAYKTRRKMNRQFGRREDPFSYATTPYEAARLAAMDEALGAGPLGPVLEVGCAEGHFTEKLIGRSSRVLAVDISAVALDRARKRAASAVFLEADLLTWEPGAEGPFDAVIVADVLYYLDRAGVRAEFAALFPRVASWLKPGGRLLLAHGFAGDKELARRRAFRERFERAGLRLVAETIPEADRGGVRCLLSTLEKI